MPRLKVSSSRPTHNAPNTLLKLGSGPPLGPLPVAVKLQGSPALRFATL